MKKLFAVIIAVLLLSSFLFCRAEDGYKENFETFVGSGLEDILDSDTKEKLAENGINPEDSGWVNNVNAENVFSFCISLIKGEMKKPLASLILIAVTVLIVSALSAFGSKKSVAAASVVSVGAIALILISDIYSCITASESGIKLCAEFMTGFVPIFAALISASGRTLTAVSSSTVLLLCANAVSTFAAFGVLPLMGGYLSISIVSGISPLVSNLQLAKTIKKITLWILSLISTVFLGVLSVQTAVNSAADGVTVKTAKFILGTSVPVAGTVLSEAASAVMGSVSFLKTSVGIYAVIAIAVIMLPVITDIILWRGCCAIGSGIGDFLGTNKISSLLKSVDSVLSCLLGIILLVTALFVISLTVLVSAGRGV